MSSKSIKRFGDANSPWTLPEQDLGRQAVDSLKGYVYQLHQSATAWLALGPDDLLHLEVAEDFAQTVNDAYAGSILAASQVKDTGESGSVTLNTPAVIEAIQALFRLQESNPGRLVRFSFLTTSEIGSERNNPLTSGRPGIQTWQDAARDGTLGELRSALMLRVPPCDLHTFIETASDEMLHRRLIASFTFACGAADWQSIEWRNRERLVAMRDEFRSSAEMAARAYDALIGHLLRTILASDTRTVDRPTLISVLERATSISVASGFLEREVMPWESLVELAESLLEAGVPPSARATSVDATAGMQAALKAAEETVRKVSSVVQSSMHAESTSFEALADRPERAHFVIGEPGSGKSTSLWRAAKALLAAGQRVPLFLPIARLTRWTEALAPIEERRRGVAMHALLTDPRVCVFLDGWSEFAMGTHAPEKATARRALSASRVIVTGLQSDAEDATFKIWLLDLLPRDVVVSTLGMARPERVLPADPIIDLLRLPLLLSLHILGDADGNSIGELLRQFHDQRTRNFPEGFTDALAGGAAALELGDTRSFGRLKTEFLQRARERALTQPELLLHQLGTLAERAGEVRSVHDLYWSWLVGVGILKENRVAAAVIPLKSRASIALALQSGPKVSSDSIEEVVPRDLVFAAMLDAGRAERRLHPGVADGITTAFADSRLANQSRAYLAALASRRPEYLSKALAFLSRVDGAKLHFPELLNALDVHFLFEHRNVLANWIGSPGSSSVIGVIAERGGPEWIQWFGHMASAGKISHVEALGAALGCGDEIPVWGESALDELLTKSPWLTRACAQRGANRTLARFIASNYDRLIEGSVSGSTGYFQRNQVLVTCGDDDVFERLLQDFPLMSSRAQEMVSYAVVARGPKWIAAFQRIAFARPKGSGSHHQLLTEQFSPSIDEAAGRTWIDVGHYEAGWRVVIAHRGLASLPELLAQLPDSLGGHPNLPALHVMQYIKDPPAALTLELWRRLSGQMQPRVTQDLIQALATVDSHGMVSIVHMISAAKGSFPAAFLPTVAGLYEKWRQKHGRSITLRLASGVQQPFERRAAKRYRHFCEAILSLSPDLTAKRGSPCA